ncbi:MAG: hypothetical protein ONB05_08715 [candidate division KSB1 bacterium]|nr:hypothetical protein [candidate division KSB1 bacterium]
MQVIPGIVEKGNIRLNQPIPAEDGTSVLVFIMPKIVDINSTGSLFGKWTWYTNEVEWEVKHAWQSWAEKANSL